MADLFPAAQVLRIDEIPEEPCEDVIRTIYSLYYPETRQVVDEIWGGRPHALYERAYAKRQEQLGARFLDIWRNWCGIGMGLFEHRSVTCGASEPIAHLIMTPRGNGRVHVFDGEYEGYQKFAKASGRPVTIHPRGSRAVARIRSLRFFPDDQFWISNPSSIDGEYWDDFDAFVTEMNDWHPDVPIYLDVTYVGAVKRPQPLIPSMHPNIRAVVFSLSKPFGIYYHRVGGIWSRDPIPSLEGSYRWFNNPLSMTVGAALMKRYAVDELPKKYARDQQKVLNSAKRRGLVPTSAQPCNVVLLARANEGPPEFARGEGNFRFCLTPGMDRRITLGG